MKTVLRNTPKNLGWMMETSSSNWRLERPSQIVEVAGFLGFSWLDTLIGRTLDPTGANPIVNFGDFELPMSPDLVRGHAAYFDPSVHCTMVYIQVSRHGVDGDTCFCYHNGFLL